MKKLLFVALSLVFAFTSIVQAQSREEIIVSRERYESLVKLSKKTPKETGLNSVDQLAESATNVLVESIRITPLVEGLYYRSIGESVDGVADVNVKKPTLEECEALSERIAKQAIAIKATVGNIEGAAKELKGVRNPLVAGKAVKLLDYSKDALSIVGEESLFQVKATASIIQTITRPVVGVAAFSCEADDRYSGLVAEKVVEMLTNTKRFRVVDRTSNDKVREVELPKSEAFMDSKNAVEQDIAVAAKKMITGHITEIPVYAMKKNNGSVKGYKGSVAFQLKVVDVVTGLSTEAASFQGKASDLMLSPESAVSQAMVSLQGELEAYFRQNFPVTAKVLKVLKVKKEAAATILLGAGKAQGIKVGDKFTVERVETLDGQPYPTLLGEVEVTKLTGESFSECAVPKKMGAELLASFNEAKKIVCKLTQVGTKN